MLAAKQGNYSLSYSIYTNLLHDSQYDCKLKSEILASRATTLLLEEKCFESIDDCTQAIAFNQWNKLAYVVRAACWMIKQEYAKAVEDYSKLFHFFDQSQHVLDLLNLAYQKLKTINNDIDDQQSIKIEQEKEDTKQHRTSSAGTCVNTTQSLSVASPTASFIQPAVYLCYPYQAYPTCFSTNNEQQPTNGEEIQQPTCTSKGPTKKCSFFG
jgi:tetratricopeptide (TPR) repeat protein